MIQRVVSWMIFYTQSTGTVRAVNVNWNDDGWNVNANDLDYQNENLGVRPTRRFKPCFGNTLSNLGSFFLFLEDGFLFQGILLAL